MGFSGLKSRTALWVLRDGEGMKTLRESIMWEIPISPLKQMYLLSPSLTLYLSHTQQRDVKIFPERRRENHHQSSQLSRS